MPDYDQEGTGGGCVSGSSAGNQHCGDPPLPSCAPSGFFRSSHFWPGRQRSSKPALTEQVMTVPAQPTKSMLSLQEFCWAFNWNGSNRLRGVSISTLKIPLRSNRVFPFNFQILYFCSLTWLYLHGNVAHPLRQLIVQKLSLYNWSWPAVNRVVPSPLPFLFTAFGISRDRRWQRI